MRRLGNFHFILLPFYLAVCVYTFRARKMKRVLAVSLCLIFISGVAFADIFGTGANQFEIDFVNISGDNGDLGSWSAGTGYTFSGVDHDDYRIGMYEITNDPWNKFRNEYGTVNGNPSDAYDLSPYWTGTDVPTNNTSWYEAAQFCNYLNTSKGYDKAYKFSGTQGTSSYSLQVWQSHDLGYDADNPYRNSNAYYFLPTEDEWVKAAYWNGSNLQTYSTTDDSIPVAGVQSNYNNAAGGEPWNVGSGSEELNGTFDMMGNVWEWIESPYDYGNYISDSFHSWRGASYNYGSDYALRSSVRANSDPANEHNTIGFRVASVPEPVSILLFGLGGFLIRRKK